jgi:hypothetical protein
MISSLEALQSRFNRRYGRKECLFLLTVFILFVSYSIRPPRCYSPRGILNRPDDVKFRSAMFIDMTRSLSHEF